MNETDRYNRVNIHHHLREDVVVLLPHVAYRNGTIGYGDGCVYLLNDTSAIGDAILQMLDHCATADTSPLERQRDLALERMRRGFELTHDEHFPSFDAPDNWGRIYERFPEILCHPRVSARYFATADISDRGGSEVLTLNQLRLRRKDRGIYTCGDSADIARGAGADSIGDLVSERLQSWRPKPSFIANLIA
jgi:hypothetical protein